MEGPLTTSVWGTSRSAPPVAVAVPGSLTSSFLLGSGRQRGVVEGAEVLRAHLALSPADCYPEQGVCVCVS